MNKDHYNTIRKRFCLMLNTESSVKTIVSCGRFSGHFQNVFCVAHFLYDKTIQNRDVSENVKSLDQRFKYILQLSKTHK